MVTLTVDFAGSNCTYGDVRLVNGRNQYEGRVEVCINNQWGTVCDNSWSATDATTVCKQLEYAYTSSMIKLLLVAKINFLPPFQLENLTVMLILAKELVQFSLTTCSVLLLIPGYCIVLAVPFSRSHPTVVMMMMLG